MKKIRTILATILCAAMVIAMVGCGAQSSGSSGATSSPSESSGSGTEATAFYDGSRAINLVVPFAAGGGTDLLARTLAANMEKFLPCSINVNNMTGGGAGGTGMAYACEADPDGYTILAGSETSLLVPVMNDLDYTAEDFNFLTAQLGPGGILVTNKATGITTMEEAIADSVNNCDVYALYKIKNVDCNGPVFELNTIRNAEIIFLTEDEYKELAKYQSEYTYTDDVDHVYKVVRGLCTNTDGILNEDDIIPAYKAAGGTINGIFRSSYVYQLEDGGSYLLNESTYGLCEELFANHTTLKYSNTY